MLKSLSPAALAAAALLTAGCLHGLTTHTLYISSDGSLEWVTDEADVHSTETEPAARRAEEQAYLAAAADTSSRLGRALASLGPVAPPQALVIRGSAPYRVMTSARYDSVERVLERLFLEAGLSAEVRLTSEDGRFTLTVSAPLADGRAGESEGPAGALLEDVERFRFVLTDGEFVDGTNVNFESERIATIGDAWKEGESPGFSMSWVLIR